MREFTKQVITALKEDDWHVRPHAIKHVKSFLIIDTDDMQPEDVPYKFTWLERRVIKHYVSKLRDRMLVAQMVEARINPRKPSSYPHNDSFLKGQHHD
jgi:hypothetical protein